MSTSGSKGSYKPGGYLNAPLGTGTASGCSGVASTCSVSPRPDGREAADASAPGGRATILGCVSTGGSSGVDILLLGGGVSTHELGGGVATCELCVLGGGVVTCVMSPRPKGLQSAAGGGFGTLCTSGMAGGGIAALGGGTILGCVSTGGSSGVDILLLGGGVSTHELGGGVSTCELCVLGGGVVACVMSPRPKGLQSAAGGGFGTLCTSGMAGGGIAALGGGAATLACSLMLWPMAAGGLNSGMAGGDGAPIVPTGPEAREAADASMASGALGALRFGGGGTFEGGGTMTVSAPVAGDTLGKCSSIATTLCASEMLAVGWKCFPTRHVTVPGFNELCARAKSCGLSRESKTQVAS